MDSTNPVFGWAAASSHDSNGQSACRVLGEVSVRWSTRYDKKRLFVQVPFGAQAEIDFCGVTKSVGSGYHIIEI